MSDREVGSSDCFPGHGLFQNWTLVRSTPEIVSLQGVITSLKVNTEGWHGLCADYDWNIFIRPDPGYLWTLTNSRNATNGQAFINFLESWGVELTEEQKSEMRQIELEVMNASSVRNAIPLASRFPVGSWVEASGWWVEDWGHDGKTELHPLLLLIGGHRSSSRFNIYMSRDETGRFSLRNVPQDVDLPFPDANEIELANPQSNPRVHTLREVATVDAFNKLPPPFNPDLITDADYVASWNRLGSRVTAAPKGFYPSSISLHGQMGEPGLVSHPGYYADFIRGAEPLLEESVGRRVMQQNGQKVIVFDISMHLKNPTDGQLAYVEWRVDEALAGGGYTAMARAGPKVNFQLRYCPAAGWAQTSMKAAVVGCTRPREWYPGRRTSVNQMNPLQEARTFVQAARQFTIDPSNVEVRAQPIEIMMAQDPEFALLGTTPRERLCTVGYKIEAIEHLFPGAAASLFQWIIRISRDQDGSPTKRAVKIDMNRRYGVEDLGQGFKVSYDPANRSHLGIWFDRSGSSVQFAGGRAYVSSGNQMRLHVTAYLQTDLGEEASASTTELHLPPCVVGMTWEDAFKELEKAIMAVRVLSARGVLPGPEPWPPPRRLSRIWPPKGVQSWGNPLRDRPGDNPETVELRGLVARWVGGEKLSPEEIKSIDAGIELGRKLVDLPLRIGKPAAAPTSPIDKRLSADFAVRGAIRIEPGISFLGNTARLDRGVVALLRSWVETMRPYDSNVEIAVFTDDRLSPEASLKLAQRRAESVTSALTRLGADPKRVRPIGYGSQAPLPGHAPGDQRNNRVEFHFR